MNLWSDADWEPQTDLPWVGQGTHRPRRWDRVVGRFPPAAQHRVLLWQHQHGRLPAAVHAGWPGVCLSGQTRLVNAPTPQPPPPQPHHHVEELYCLPHDFHRTFFSAPITVYPSLTFHTVLTRRALEKKKWIRLNCVEFLSLSVVAIISTFLKCPFKIESKVNLVFNFIHIQVSPTDPLGFRWMYLIRGKRDCRGPVRQKEQIQGSQTDAWFKKKRKEKKREKLSNCLSRQKKEALRPHCCLCFV